MACSTLLLLESLPGMAVRPHLSKDRGGGAHPAEEWSNALPFFITSEPRPPTVAPNELTPASRHRLPTRGRPGKPRAQGQVGIDMNRVGIASASIQQSALDTGRDVDALIGERTGNRVLI